MYQIGSCSSRKMQLVREEISFKRGKDPKKSLGVGVAIENRDPNKRLENFRAAFPEIGISYNSSKSTSGGYEKFPHWQMISAGVNNPNDGLSLDERGEKMLNWLKSYTDFDIIEIENSFDRRYMPGMLMNPTEQYEQHYTFQMRNEEDMS